MKVGFVGLGNMGTTMANLVAGNGHAVLGWEHDAAVVGEVNVRHSNSRYLPGVSLSPRLVATGCLEDVFAGCGVVFIALPSAFIRGTLEPGAGAVRQDVLLVNLAKGIESGTGLTSLQVLSRIFPSNSRVMLSGPSIANEIARGLPTVVVLAGEHAPDLARVSALLENEFFRTSRSDDAVGVELGGILKNIYAIGLGIFDGAGVRSINFRSVYLTLALEEIKNIGKALGARSETFFFLSGLGDLFATSLSEHSHNRRFGELLARGDRLEDIRRDMGILPEGYNTLRVTLELAGKRGIPAPVARDLARVISGAIDARGFIDSVIKEERIYYESHTGC